jgi:hypothetical protein
MARVLCKTWQRVEIACCVVQTDEEGAREGAGEVERGIHDREGTGRGAKAAKGGGAISFATDTGRAMP